MASPQRFSARGRDKRGYPRHCRACVPAQAHGEGAKEEDWTNASLAKKDAAACCAALHCCGCSRWALASRPPPAALAVSWLRGACVLCSALLCNPQPAASPYPFAPRCFFPVAGARRTTEPCALLIIRQTARPDCSRPDAGSPPGRSLELAAEDAATIRPAKSGGSSELLSHPGAS